jgi:quercetin dioxygenase-like cupin family protein
MKTHPAAAIAGVAALFAASHAQSNDATVTVTPVAKERATIAGQAITAPPGDLEINVSIYEIPPGAKLPVHRHPYPRYGYVLSGTLTVTNLDTDETDEFGPGGFIVESVGLSHFGSNPGPEVVRLLVIDQTPPGEPNVTLEPEKAADAPH